MRGHGTLFLSLQMSYRAASFATLLALAFAPAASGGPRPSNDAPVKNRPAQVRGDEITPGLRTAVEKGLAYLASHQHANGSFGEGNGQSGITSLGALAFMQAGNLPGRGKYGGQVAKALDFVLDSCQESGLIAADGAEGPMYGHGFATLFLGEVYGMTQDERVKEKLERAVRLLQKCQNPEGGWRYAPAPYDADISITICQVMALRAARDAGIKVEKDVIDKAIHYVRTCQNSDGGFAYQANRGMPSGYARSAAGVASLYYAGVFEGDDLSRGLRYLIQFLPGKSAEQAQQGTYFYGNYYGVQAMFLAGGDYWARFYPALRDQIIARQNQVTGGWSGEAGDDYATAMALIILQMPNRYLPVYAGKGPGS